MSKVTAIDSKHMSLDIDCEHGVVFWDGYKTTTKQVHGTPLWFICNRVASKTDEKLMA